MLSCKRRHRKRHKGFKKNRERFDSMKWNQQTMRNMRVNVGISLIALLAIVSIIKEVRLFFKLHDSYWATLDIQAYERRYELAQSFLPPFGVFGYVDDFIDPVSSDIEYVLAVYNFAPRLLERSTKHECIIGNFQQRPFNKEIVIKKGLLVVKDFGNGVVVLRKGQL